MAAETQYGINTGMVTISTANSNLDGTGTLSSAIIAAGTTGSFVKTISIKAITNTTQGVVRIFLGSTKVIKLLLEVEIPAVTKSAHDPAFETTIPVNLYLKNGIYLYASTQNSESFNVIVEAVDWSYYSTSVRSETTKYTAKNGTTLVSTANTALNGSGTIETVLTSGGCNIQSITIKAIENTTAGMIRLFLYDGTNTKLWKEIPVEAVTKSSDAPAFYHKIYFDNSFALESGWALKASTEKGEDINIIAEALQWSYPA